jgi:deazaflavin-dependent oxidoreductase (nitroreductase family)
MDQATRDRLAQIRTIDLTTIGRRSGQPSRIEIWWFRFEDRFIITGRPGKRDWFANVRVNPDVIIHADGDDFPGKASVVTDQEFRRRMITTTKRNWYSSQEELDRMIRTAPMIEVEL